MGQLDTETVSLTEKLFKGRLGCGGFFLPILLLGLRQFKASCFGGFAIYRIVAFGCDSVILYVSRVWEGIVVGADGIVAPAKATA